MGAEAKEADWLIGFLQAREGERARLSRVLHDEIGQILSAAGLQLDLLRMDCAQVAGVAVRVVETQKLLEQAVAQLRDLSYELNPSIVERVGLQTALEKLIARCRKSFPGAVQLRWDESLRMPAQAAQACYKIVEQALENAARHSGAGRIEVTVERKVDGVQIEVRDDGSGFRIEDAVPGPGALGLRLMEYHARSAGMAFSLASAPGKGTIVKAIYPRRERAAAGEGHRRRGSGG